MPALNWLASQLAWEQRLSELRDSGRRPQANLIEHATSKAA